MPDAALDRESRTELVRRGVVRSFLELGYGALVEFPLRSGRRADVIAMSRTGEFAIIEVKSTEADFRSDRKWMEYREFCDRFYFAVDPDFPRAILPGDCGLLVADGFTAATVREAPAIAMHPNRRRQLLLRFALHAASRAGREAINGT
jgi:hypothetical protein